MSKKQAHKQRVAMCLNTVNEHSIKSLIENLSFKDFLIFENQMPDVVRLSQLISNNSSFREYFGNDKKQAAILAKEFRQEYPEYEEDYNLMQLSPDEAVELIPQVDQFISQTLGDTNVVDRFGDDASAGANLYSDDVEADHENFQKSSDTDDEPKQYKRDLSGGDDWDSLLKGKTDRSQRFLQQAQQDVANPRAQDDINYVDTRATKLAAARNKTQQMKKSGISGSSSGRQSASGVLYRIKKARWFNEMTPEQQQQVISGVRSGMSGSEARAAAMSGA